MKYLIPILLTFTTSAISAEVDTQAWHKLRPSNDIEVYNENLNTISINENVSLTGYIADTNIDGGFILVPYLKKCFHFPPPAYNQTIFVSSENKLNKMDIERKVTVEGSISSIHVKNKYWTTGYTLSDTNITFHDEYAEQHIH